MSRRDDIVQIIAQYVEQCIERGVTLGTNTLANRIEDYLHGQANAGPPEAHAEAREPTRFVWNRDGMFSVGLKDAEPEVNFDGQKWIREEDYSTRPASSDGALRGEVQKLLDAIKLVGPSETPFHKTWQGTDAHSFLASAPGSGRKTAEEQSIIRKRIAYEIEQWMGENWTQDYPLAAQETDKILDKVFGEASDSMAHLSEDAALTRGKP
jgi:hypothetical protein